MSDAASPHADPRALVAHVAQLAALNLDDTEAARLAKDVDAILRYVDELSAVDTEGVPPTTSVLLEPAPAREDVVLASLTSAEALAGAPRVAGEPGAMGFAVPVFVES